jgi:hypothetical protein
MWPCVGCKVASAVFGHKALKSLFPRRLVAGARLLFVRPYSFECKCLTVIEAYPLDHLAQRKEGERSIFSVVTGTHYGIKIPPD